MAIKGDEDVADKNAAGFRRTIRGHADNEQAGRGSIAAALPFAQLDRLTSQAKVSALEPSMLEKRRGRLPRDRGWNDDAKTADFRGGRDAEHVTADIGKRAAGESI